MPERPNILLIMGSVRAGRRCPQIAEWVRAIASTIGGYPAALKNALDHLYKEWSRKPLVIVTYGGNGGGKCAEQLRQVGAG